MSSEEVPRRAIASRSEFHETVRLALAQAAEAGCREICLIDDDFADWPLGEPALIETLTRWAYAHRRLIVLARHFDAIVSRHARWVQWRRQWSHVVSCHANNELEAGQMPTMLLVSGSVSVRLFDRVHYRGVATGDTADFVVWREAFDAILQRSEESFPATTLGL